MPPATPATTRSWVRRRSAARRRPSSGSLTAARYPRDGRHGNRRSAPRRMRPSQATPGRRGRERPRQGESRSRDPPERQHAADGILTENGRRLATPPGTRSPHSLAPKALLPSSRPHSPPAPLLRRRPPACGQPKAAEPRRPQPAQRQKNRANPSRSIHHELEAAPPTPNSRARGTAGQQRDNRNGSAQPRQDATQATAATRTVGRRAAKASLFNPCAGFD